MRVVVVGSGYVGLVTGACLSDIGNEVTCIDTDEQRIAQLLKGDMPIYEPGLAELVKANVSNGQLKFSTALETPVRRADVVFIAVGTPTRDSDGSADLTSVYSVAAAIAPFLRQGAIVITKSTVPVGTGDAVERLIAQGRADHGVVVASNPEFLREGTAIEDFMHPDRIVVGTKEMAAQDVITHLYRPLIDLGTRLVFVGRRSAELIKYSSNAFLALKLSFINEIADFCEAAGADVRDVARGMGLDPRIGPEYLQVGPGYGGSCFPKDTKALANAALDVGAQLRLVEATIEVNDLRKQSMARRVVEACLGTMEGKCIAVLGLTFKPNTDDMRDAPSVEIIQELQRLGAEIRAYDPQGQSAARKILDHVTYAEDPYQAARGAEAVVIITEWDEFRVLDFARLRKTMRSPIIVDFRNICPENVVRAAGFSYRGVGLGETSGTLWAQAAE